MTAVIERDTYVCDETRMSILPLEDVLAMASRDNGGGPVWEILDRKRQDFWYSDVVNTIREYGVLHGIRISSFNEVVDGHHRIAAFVDLGWKFIPVENGELPEIYDGWHEEYC